MQRPYDPAQEVTVSGTVTDILHPSMGRRMTGTHLMMSVDGKSVEVHLGPTSFLDSKQFALAKGDTLILTGSKAAGNGSEFIIAREITKGSQTLTLRDKNGIPSWSRRGGKSMN